VGTYIIRRLIQAAFLLFLLSIIFFLLARLQPGGACGAFVGTTCETRFHVDQPISNQYVQFVGSYIHGDFGTNIGGQSIAAEIRYKLPPTLLLVAVSFILQQLIALPLGMFAALRQYSFFDQALTFGSYVALSLPAFLLGLFVVYFFSVQWQLLPSGHAEDATLPLFWSSDWFSALWHDPALTLGDLLRHLILPAFVLTLTGIAIDSRFMRAAMLQVIHEDYIRTAKAKGLTRRSIVFKHAFRNALLPIITNMALYLPALLGGVVVVETVFSWGGLGYLFSTAIRGNLAIVVTDYATLQALLLLSAFTVILTNLLADLAYGWLDPRIRFDE
jgi:peptide/nickel transport system permease protein